MNIGEKREMSLGYLDSIEIAGLMPLKQPRFFWDLEKEKVVTHVFWAPSGCGKTTLCDAIEFSLFRNLKYKDTDALREKFKVSTREKIRKGFIKARWNFSGKSVILRQNFSGTKIFSFKNNKRIPSEEYSKRVLDLSVSFKNLQNLYNGITFIREIRNYPIFEELERKRIIEALRELLYDPQIYRMKERSNALLAKLQEEKKNKEQEQQRLWASMNIVRDEVKLKEALSKNMTKMKQIEKQIKERELIISDLKHQLEECWKPPQLKKQNKLTEEITQRQIELKKLEEQLNLIIRQIQELDNGILPDLDKRKRFLSDNPICSTCLQNHFKVWDQRVKEVCPECGLSWSPLSRRESSSDVGTDRSILMDQQTRVTEKIISLKKEISSFKKERKRLNDKYERNQKICFGIRAKIEDHQGKLDDLKLEKQNLENHVQFLREAMDPETKSNFDNLSVELERIDEEIEMEEHNIEKLQAQIEGSMQDFLADVEQQFSTLASEYLDFGNLFLDLRAGRIIVDGESMSFFNMSGSERDVCDLVIRICIWKSLIKFGKAEKGILIIDSLEVYDEQRKKGMIKILQSLLSEEFITIFATSNSGTARELSDIPTKYECERQGLWFFFRESQWLKDNEEKIIDQEFRISSQDRDKNEQNDVVKNEG